MRRWPAVHPLAAAMMLAALAQALCAVFGASPILSGGLVDADCYSRLARVLELHQTGAWWDGVDHRINAPFGEALQWTRPLDVLIELVAAPLGWLIPYDRALFLWGALVSPALLLATLAVLWRGLRIRLGHGGFLLLVALFHVSPSLLSAFLIGRPDHHSLLALLFIAQLMLLLRVLAGAGDGWSAANGLVGGLALWVSLESAVPQAFFGMSMVALWLAGRLEARRIAVFSAALFLAAGLAIMVEFPPSLWMAPAYDRISWVHAILLGLNAAVWTAIWRWPPARRSGRLIAALACGGLLAAVVLGVFPKLLAGPFVDHGAEARAWLSTVSEWQPLWPSDRQRAASLFAELGPAMIVVPWLLSRRRRDPCAMVMLAGVAVFVGASLTAVRWASYAQAIMLLPWCEAVLHLWRSETFRLNRLAATAAVGLGFVLALAVAPAGEARARTDASPKQCPVAPLARALPSQAGQGHRPILMTYLFLGPELEWRTDFDLVGIPSANEATMTDTAAVLGATDDRAAQQVLARRGVSYLLTCPNSPWAGDYYKAGGETLHQRLDRGDVPSWLERVALPKEAGGFQLYRVLP